MPFVIKAFSNIPYFKKILESKIVIGLVDFDAAGIDAIQENIFPFKDKQLIREKIQSLVNKKEPVTCEYNGVYLLALIPSKNHDWGSFRSDSSRYRLEELMEDEKNNGEAVDRLFKEIKKIITKADSK